MTLLHLGFAIGAILFGVRAMGYWLALHFGAARSASEWWSCAGVICYSVLLFVILSSASAYFRERTSGTRAIVFKALYFTDVYGLPPLALFTVLSKGTILQIPAATGLIILFFCFALVFRSPVSKQTRG